MKNIIKEFKIIWKNGDFTPILITSVLAIVIVKLLPEGNSIVNNCFF